MRESQRDTAQGSAQQLPPDPLASAVAHSVSELRRTAGLSERAAARKLGTSQTQLRRMEDPRYLPSLRSLSRLASVYGYDLRVDFTLHGASAKSSPAARKAKPSVNAAAKPTGKPASKPARRAAKPGAKPRASASGSPSRGRAGAPRRDRVASRGTGRKAAPRRRS